MRDHVQNHRGREAQQGEHADHAAGSVARTAGDYAGDRHHHQDDRDGGQANGEDPHVVYEIAPL